MVGCIDAWLGCKVCGHGQHRCVNGLHGSIGQGCWSFIMTAVKNYIQLGKVKQFLHVAVLSESEYKREQLHSCYVEEI